MRCTTSCIETDVLQYAYACCKANQGAPGVDGVRFEDIEAYGLDRWLGELAQELREKTYQPEAVRRVYIPKPNGKAQAAGHSRRSGSGGADGGDVGLRTDLRGRPAARAIRLSARAECARSRSARCTAC